MLLVDHSGVSNSVTVPVKVEEIDHTQVLLIIASQDLARGGVATVVGFTLAKDVIGVRAAVGKIGLTCSLQCGQLKLC